VVQRFFEGGDLAQPLLALRLGQARVGVRLDVIEDRCLGGVEAEVGAADARVLVNARGAVGAEAVAEGDAAELEVLLELGPLIGVTSRYSAESRNARRRVMNCWWRAMSSSWNTAV
jgi:hypothetical protein